MNDAAAHFSRRLEHESDSWDLFSALEQRDEITVVDARSPEAYTRERIPGAISFPHRLMNEESTATMDRSRLYVVYCDGIGCNASTKGALRLACLGFRVKELMGGLDWWKRDGYATDGEMASEGRALACNCA